MSPKTYIEDEVTPWRYEIHALVVLLCSPCEFHEACVKAKSPEQVKEAIDKLNFSQEFKNEVAKAVDTLFESKSDFKKVVDAFMTIAGQGRLWTHPPHPSSTDTYRIIGAMQQLGRC
ncbi:MAG: hypothetical protein LAP39_28340 [Acidobacteriia bacterium]|nr:hypothetical protein [Terriglobia bacterium]